MYNYISNLVQFIAKNGDRLGPSVKLHLVDIDPQLPLIDLLTGYHQIFQQKPISISEFLTVSRDKADAFLIPHDASDWNREFLNKISRLGQKKPVIFFNRSEIPRSINLPNSVSLQTSYLPGSNMNQVIVPYNVISLKSLRLRNYQEFPTISFAGYVPKLSPRRIIQSVKQRSKPAFLNNSAVVRRIGLIQIKKRFPKNSILIQRSHYGGVDKLITDSESFRLEYLSSIEESDFVFAPRGDANSSQRFYESMSAGRMTLVPESGIKLPVVDRDLTATFILLDLFSRNLLTEVTKLWDSLDSKKYRDLQLDIRETFQHFDYGRFFRSLFTLKDFDELLMRSVSIQIHKF